MIIVAFNIMKKTKDKQQPIVCMCNAIKKNLWFPDDMPKLLFNVNSITNEMVRIDIIINKTIKLSQIRF